MNQKIKINIDKIKLINEQSDNQLAIVEVWCCHDNMNSHKLPIELDAIKMAESTLFNKFLVAGYDGHDFQGHVNERMMIVGFFPKENSIRYEEKDGKTFLVAQAIMSKIYAKWAYEIFADPDEDNYREVSMEITLVETKLKDDGFKWITAFIFNGITLLGKSNRAACSGSNAQLIKFETLIQDGEELYKSFKKKQSKLEYDNLDFSIPESVKLQVEQGLKLRNKHNVNVTSPSLNVAKYIKNNSIASPEKVNYIANYLLNCSNHNLNQENLPLHNIITWQLYGGYEGLVWSNNLMKAMNKCNNKKIFSQNSLNSSLHNINDEKSDNTNNIIDINNQFELKNNNKKEDFLMNFTKTPELFAKLIECCNNQKFTKDEQESLKYSVLDYCEKFMYTINQESKKMFAIPYTYSEDKISADFDNSKFAIMKYEAVDEDVGMEVMLSNAKSFCEAMGMKYATDSNQELATQVARSEKETDDEKKKTEAEKKEMSNKIVEMSARLKEMEINTKELKELREFKSNVIEQENKSKIEFALNDVSNVMPKEKVDEWRNRVVEFANIDAWQNAVKADGFNYVKNSMTNNNEGFIRMGLPYNTNESKDKSKSKKLWE